VIPRDKLRYCLDPLQGMGRHKARVFKSALGLTIEDAAELERVLRDGISEHRAERGAALPGGSQRWVVEWIVRGRLGPLRFVSAWDIASHEIRPRLVSCYLKKVKR
jgi:hypothetical protein